MYADTKGKQKIEGQTMQWPSEKPKDTQTMAHKKIHIKQLYFGFIYLLL
jgi:hypothetical protein